MGSNPTAAKHLFFSLTCLLIYCQPHEFLHSKDWLREPVAKWSRGMIPALGAGGPGFKSRFGPDILLSRSLNLNQKVEKTSRGHSELNQGPAGLQPDALPLSYIPCLWWERAKPSKHLQCEGRECYFPVVPRDKKVCQEWDLNPCPLTRTRILMLTPYQGAKIEPWVWRLRPLGHPDILSNSWNDI